MNYENINNEILRFNFQKQNLFCMLGLYLFSLSSNIFGYTAYLFLESFGFVEQKIIAWNGQGLFWFLILFFGFYLGNNLQVQKHCIVLQD